MKSWQQLSLGELCDVTAGGTPSRAVAANFGGDIPWVKIGDMLQGRIVVTEERLTRFGLESSAAKVLPAGTVLMSIFATVGRTAILGIDAATNQAIVGIRPHDVNMLSPEYLRRFLDFEASSLERQARGVAQANINSSLLRAVRVPVPPILEQQRIAAILDKADALRAMRRAAIAKLDTLAQSIFLDMFGDPSTNPKRWPIAPLSGLFSSSPIFGTMIPPIPDGGSWLSLRVANIQNWDLDLTDLKFVELPPRMVDRHSLRDGDLVLARAIASEAHLGKAIVVYPGARQWAFDSHLMRLRFDRGQAEPEFVRHTFRTKGGRRLFLSVTRRSAVQFNVNTKEIAGLRVPVPPVSLQRRFTASIGGVTKAKVAHRASMARIDALCASLQHRAFRGEL